jgi:hypothetical protein
VEDFANWDPDLAGDARRPAAHVPAAAPAVAVATAPVVSPTPPVSTPVPVAPSPAPVATSPAPVAPPPAPVAPPVATTVRPTEHHAVPTVAPAPPQISLAEAFASLLAAEHGQPITPAASHRPAALTEPPTPAVAAPPDIDEIVQRVLDRLQDQDMRQAVVDVAERLVREEIERIKRANG